MTRRDENHSSVCGHNTRPAVSFCAWFVSFIAISAFSLSPVLIAQVPLSQLYHKAFTGREGVPSGIQDVVQGSDGFLWIATSNGLYRFDGISFEPYRALSETQFLSDTMTTLSVTKEGSLWVSYLHGGVSRLKDGHVQNYTQREGMRGGYVGNVTMDLQGRFWIGGTGGLQYIQDGKVILFHGHHGEGDMGGDYTAMDSTGTLWLNTLTRGVIALRNGESDFVQAPGPHAFGCTSARTFGALCWSAEPSRSVVRRYFLDKGQPVTEELAVLPANAAIVTATLASDGTVWIATRHGIRRVSSLLRTGHKPQLLPETMDANDGLTSHDVFSIIEDVEGSIWAATSRGIDQLRTVAFKRQPLEDTYFALASSPQHDHVLYAENRLFKLTEDTVLPLAWQSAGANTRALYEAPSGTVWIGTNHGLKRYAQGKADDIQLPPFPAGRFVTAQTMVEGTDQTLWASFTNLGLHHLVGNVWTSLKGVADIPSGPALTSLRDGSGDLWFGYPRNVLVRIHEGQITVFNAPDSLTVGTLRTLIEHDGRLWIGGTAGLAIRYGNEFHSATLANSNSVQGVTGTAFLPNGNLWINASSGIVEIPASEIKRFYQSPTYRMTARRFNALDGIEGVAVNYQGNPSAVLGPNSTVYLATETGLYSVDPSKIRLNQVVPKVWVTAIKVMSVAIEKHLQSVTIGPEKGDLEIDYSSPSLLIPERVRFRYRLDGFDKDWVDAGPRRQALYSKLPAGHYTFHVLACNDSGLWNESGASVSVIVRPRWNEAMWFKLLAVGIVLATIYMLIRVRISRERRLLAFRLREREAERERIARELHDTLFQGVEGGMLMINAVVSRIPTEPDQTEVLHNAFTGINQSMSSARGLVFDLRNPMGPVDLERSLRGYEAELRPYSTADYVMTVVGVKRQVQTHVSAELLKISREALANAFKHSGAKTISITVHHQPDALEIRIVDDGVGIAPDVIRNNGKEGHLGISNMTVRTSRIGGKLIISPRAEGGTEVVIRIPSARAYESWVSKLIRRLTGDRPNELE